VGVTCGLKQSGNPDLALILASHPCAAAAVFTTNVFKAAPVLYDLALLERAQGKLQAVLINAGNANAVTGGQGLADAEQMARWAENACHLPADSVFVMSTGVIGQKMPMDRVEMGIRIASETILTEAGRYGSGATEAIMTTDLVPKEAFVRQLSGGSRFTWGEWPRGVG
jgi:glutamate N-acetyltransferase/amino-acid N-acetyltransferase